MIILQLLLDCQALEGEFQYGRSQNAEKTADLLLNCRTTGGNAVQHFGCAEIQEQDNRILFTDKEKKNVCKTGMAPDTGLTRRLLNAGVSATGVEIKADGANSMMFNMGKSNAKVCVKSSNVITFSDVEGVDDAEENLQEIVDYLHAPEKYRQNAACQGRAGEANVPFFSMNRRD